MPRTGIPRVTEGEFRCGRCKETKPAAQFTSNQTRYNGLASNCKQCAVLVTAEWQRRNPDKVAARNKRWKQSHPEQVYGANTVYAQKRRARMKAEDPEGMARRERAFTCRRKGVSLEWYELQLAKQDNACAICRRVDNYSRPSFAVDHDHRCCVKGCSECARGLLCGPCNATLHRLEMMDGWVAKAMTYLEKYAKRE